jgi:hypothetical protein
MKQRTRNEKYQTGFYTKKIQSSKLLVSAAGSCDALPSQRFSMFPAFVFTRLFVTFLEFQPFEKTVVLDFFLENAHGFLEIVIDHFDFDFLQIYRPFLHIDIALVEALRRWLFEYLNVDGDNYMKRDEMARAKFR